MILLYLLQESEQAANDAHLALAAAAAVPAIMIVGLWIDWRRTKAREKKEADLRHQAERRERDRRYIEDKLDQDRRHHANTERLTTIETKIDPIVDWWNDTKNGR